jgi:M6 family metalloprotease-like protein
MPLGFLDLKRLRIAPAWSKKEFEDLKTPNEYVWRNWREWWGQMNHPSRPPGPRFRYFTVSRPLHLLTDACLAWQPSYTRRVSTIGPARRSNRRRRSRCGRTWFTVLLIVAALAFSQTSLQAGDRTFLGLSLGSSNPPAFWEGPTDNRLFPRPKGVVKAIMLFARFPDAELEEPTEDLFKRLVPEGQAFFKRASYGAMTLAVDVRHRWIPMDHASTSGRYDCHQWATHKTYIAEVVRKTAAEVDYSKYQIVYIVGSKNKGTPDSPTWLASRGTGVQAGRAEVLHAVTFGNDIRNPNWGWQTLAHETGHVFGLPDLYSYRPPTRRYKDYHRHVGFWDLMGFQAPGCEYLAWHKYKLGWLSDENVTVATKSTSTVLTPIDEVRGVKAVVVPIGKKEAYVVEVRSRDGPLKSRYGVLCYRVSLTLGTGEGPIQIIPAKPDDGDPELEKRFVTLYHALFFDGPVVIDATHGIKLEIYGREDRGYRIGVAR